MKKFFISSSILSANFARLGEDIKEILIAGCDFIHFDVMDNHYVSNLTFGPMVLESLRNNNIYAPIDVHLMACPVDDLVLKFAQSGASFITFHPESSDHVDKTLSLIKQCGCKVGIALNPSTPLSILDYIMDKLDIILLMGVNPGFSGQRFIPSMLNKLYRIRTKIDKFFPNILLSVDGGVNANNISDLVCVGVDIFVMGSAIFTSNNYVQFIKNIREKIKLTYNCIK
ncbi:ribulose-phosphate 3-epimerase [Buchnera aphidicola]|uniref:Ribulose-phosphate 3-epimerase n=1 Tax=Buchnera aphidicola (Stegophylla sp.) TaxID=2315800 RepID=A0A4D6YN79_9GAMM|nr:ribulose-phosphate 3-epimerase [Buchnera aphidicola (Stegophylla sp.)]QCI26495.1 ribulose-phosphate 3-epimerase [Buchnera aphidicola (Stegophylla sp.)]